MSRLAKPPLTARRKTPPLIVFIHVPKAAGSFVNRHLEHWSRDGLDHAEHYADTPGKLARMVPRLDWISGHLALNNMLELIGPTERELRIFGAIRQPLHHVAAQYNWQIEIYERGARFYQSHSEGIQTLSERIRASDNSDPKVIIDNILSSIGMFLNLQARFLLGDDIDLECKTGPGAERLALYERIALPGEVEDMLRQITGMEPDAERENVATHHFDRAVFKTEEMRVFLQRNSRFDYKLLWHLMGKDGTGGV